MCPEKDLIAKFIKLFIGYAKITSLTIQKIALFPCCSEE
jgi:hypothetical protein